MALFENESEGTRLIAQKNYAHGVGRISKFRRIFNNFFQVAITNCHQCFPKSCFLVTTTVYVLVHPLFSLSKILLQTSRLLLTDVGRDKTNVLFACEAAETTICPALTTNTGE